MGHISQINIQHSDGSQFTAAGSFTLSEALDLHRSAAARGLHADAVLSANEVREAMGFAVDSGSTDYDPCDATERVAELMRATRPATESTVPASGHTAEKLERMTQRAKLSEAHLADATGALKLLCNELEIDCGEVTQPAKLAKWAFDAIHGWSIERQRIEHEALMVDGALARFGFGHTPAAQGSHQRMTELAHMLDVRKREGWVLSKGGEQPATERENIDSLLARVSAGRLGEGERSEMVAATIAQQGVMQYHLTAMAVIDGFVTAGQTPQEQMMGVMHWSQKFAQAAGEDGDMHAKLSQDPSEQVRTAPPEIMDAMRRASEEASAGDEHPPKFVGDGPGTASQATADELNERLGGVPATEVEAPTE